MVENLIAELIGAIFTIFVLEEVMRRVERNIIKEQQREKHKKEYPIWEELDFIFGENVELMARKWTPLLPDEDKTESGFFYDGRLKECLLADAGPLEKVTVRPLGTGGNRKAFTPELVPDLAKTYLKLGSQLYELNRMFPDLVGFSRYFISMSTSLSNLKESWREFNHFSETTEIKEGTGTNVYSTELVRCERGLKNDAWKVLCSSALILEQINLQLKNSDTFEGRVPPTWLELVTSWFRK